MGFARVMAISDEAAVPDKKHCNKKKGRKEAGVAMVSKGVDAKVYTPIKLPMLRELHISAMAVGLEAKNAIPCAPFCTHLMLPLAATFIIFKAILDS